MKKLLILSVLSFFVLLLPAGMTAAPPDGEETDRERGHSEAPPGQVKKSESGANSKKPTVVVGSVDQITADSLTVTDKKDNKKSQVSVDSATQLVGQGKKSLKIGSVKLKDLIAFVSTDSGTATAGGRLKVKKIFVQEASQSAEMRRRAVSGVITNISGNILTVAHLIHRDRTYQVEINALTIITSKSKADASGSAETASGSGTLGQLAVGTRIAAVGNLLPGGGILAKRVHIIPGLATGAFKRNPVSTPSASFAPSSTPSASTTPSASLTPSSTPSASSSPAASVLP